MKNVQTSLANPCFGIIRFRQLETFATSSTTNLFVGNFRQGCCKLPKCLYFPKHHQMENKYLTTVSKSLYFPKHHHMENNCFETEKINRKINKTRINLANCSATSEDCSDFFLFCTKQISKSLQFPKYHQREIKLTKCNFRLKIFKMHVSQINSEDYSERRRRNHLE